MTTTTSRPTPGTSPRAAASPRRAWTRDRIERRMLGILRWVLLAAIAFEGWRYFPFAFLFLMARLEALSGDAEEAALVDGATPWQSFRFIVLPQLMPIIGLLAMLRTIWTFNEFDDIFLLTGGAAGTGVASVRIYNFLTVQRNVGAAAAQSVIISLILVALLLIYVLLLRRRGERA